MAGTRIVTAKTDNFDDFRKNTNATSVKLGDASTFDPKLSNEIYTYTASAGSYLFSGLDDSGSRSVSFITAPDDFIDQSSGFITITSESFIGPEFIPDAIVTQTSGFEAVISFVLGERIFLKSITGQGPFDSGRNLTCSGVSINFNRVTSLTGSSFPVGQVDVYYDNGSTTTLLEQGSSPTGYRVPSQVSPDVGTSIETNFRLNVGDKLIVHATTAVSAINELQRDVGEVSNLTTVSTTLTPAVNELDAELGTITAPAMGSTNNTVSGAIREHSDLLGTEDISTIDATVTGSLNQLHDEIGQADYSAIASTLSDSLVSLKDDIGNMIFPPAISSTNLTDAVIELNNELFRLDFPGEQNIESNVQFSGYAGGANPKTMRFAPDATLDVSDSTIMLPWGDGSAFTFEVGYLRLDSPRNFKGFDIVRDGEAHNAKLRWNEIDDQWEVIGHSGAPHELVNFDNAQRLFANNSEAGVAVTWDAVNNNFDVNATDFDITLTGSVAGTGRVTNLGNVTIETTAGPLAITLGDHTTGNYVEDVNGSTNITVTGADGEGAVKTINLADNITLPGNLTVNGNTILGNSTSDTVVIKGNLLVEGDETIINTASLEVEDSVIITNSLNQTVGEFGLAVEGATPGVIEHTLMYNYDNSRWEVDGSLILTAATLGTPSFEGIELSSGRNINLVNGTGITTGASLSGSNINATITNTDRGSSQKIFKNIVVGSSTVVAGGNNDTLRFAAGNDLGVTIDGATKTVTYAHGNTSSLSGIYGGTNTGTVIERIGVDDNGHVHTVHVRNMDSRYVTATNNTSMSTDNSNTRGSTRLYRSDSNSDYSMRMSYVGNKWLLQGYNAESVHGAPVHVGYASVAANAEAVSWSNITGKPTFDNYQKWRIGANGAYTDMTSNQAVNFVNGAGTAFARSGNTFSVNNSDRGSSQNIFKKVATSSGTAVADNNNDTLTIVGSGIATTSVSGDTVTINVPNTNVNTNYYVSSVAFNNTNGILTLNRAGLGALTVDLDGRYSTSDSNNYLSSGTFATGTGVLNLKRLGLADVNINLDGRYSRTDTNTNHYVSSGSFSTTNGVLNLKRLGLADLNIDLDGRYSQTDTNTNHYVTSASFSTSTGNLNLKRLGLSDVNVDLDGRYSQTDTNTNHYVNAAAFNDTNGILTLNRLGLSALTVDLDGRYLTSAPNNYVSSMGWNSGTGVLTLSRTGLSAVAVDLDGRYSQTDTNTTYSAGNGMQLSGTTFSILDDMRTAATRIIGQMNGYGTFENGTVKFGGIASNNLIRFATSGTLGGTIYADGNIFAYSTATSSDERLKKDITRIENPIEKIQAIDGVEYTWNDKTRREDTKDIGVIAQNVEKVLPEIVSEFEGAEDGETYKAVDYGKLTAVLIEAVKAQQVQIDDMKAEIAALKS